MRLHSVAVRFATTAAVAATLAGLAPNVSAQGTDKTSDFKWSDQIAAGRRVRISDMNGKVTVGQATGNRVEVTAVKRWRTGDPETVRILAHKDGEDVVVCALWDKREDCDDSSSRRSRRSHWDDDSDDDVSVEFTVMIPKGTKLSTSTVNGGIAVTGATSDVDLGTVNGAIRVESGGGPLSASTVNGAVRARITSESANADMRFTTVNGDVVAELPDNFGADVSMTTVNGELQSDYPMTMRGRIDPHHLSVHVGATGGPRITLTTVNGSIELRKR
jgi:hypothetical protein